jgi:hypothetical protein
MAAAASIPGNVLQGLSSPGEEAQAEDDLGDDDDDGENVARESAWQDQHQHLAGCPSQAMAQHVRQQPKPQLRRQPWNLAQLEWQRCVIGMVPGTLRSEDDKDFYGMRSRSNEFVPASEIRSHDIIIPSADSRSLCSRIIGLGGGNIKKWKLETGIRRIECKGEEGMVTVRLVGGSVEQKDACYRLISK